MKARGYSPAPFPRQRSSPVIISRFSARPAKTPEKTSSLPQNRHRPGLTLHPGRAMLFPNLRFVFALLGGIFMSTVLIRDAKLSDAPRLLEIYSYYVKNTAITFEYNVPSLEEFRHLHEKHHAAPPRTSSSKRTARSWATPTRAHSSAAPPYDWSCEMTVYLDRTAKKLGFGRKIYEAMEQRLKDMGILNLYACIGYIDKEDEYLKPQQCRFSRPPRLQNGSVRSKNAAINSPLVRHV